MNSDLASIHNASLKILETTGFRVSRIEIIEALKKHGVRMEEDVAFFTEKQLMQQLACAPKRFSVFARNPQYNMDIGGGETHFAPGYGCTFVIDAQGRRRSAVYSDYIRFAQLTHQSHHFNINGGILVQPSDTSAEHSIPLMIYAAMVYSDKCLMGISSTGESVRQIMKLCSLLFGGEKAFCERPRVLTLVNTTSPLALGSIGSDTLLECARYHQPVILSPGPMSGATGPVTASGNLALGNAENLAAIAVAQILQPGLPVLYGLMPTTMNMSSGAVCIGSPASALNMVYSARMAKFYGLPNRCGGALTDAKKVNAQSGCESMMALMASIGEHTSFMLHSAGILDSFSSMSYEKFIVDLDVIRAVKAFYGKLDVSEEFLAVDEICEAGIGGGFLSSDHTFEHFKEASWLGELSINRNLGENESPDVVYEANIAHKMQQMLQSYRMPDMDRDTHALLNQYMCDELNVNKSMLVDL